MAQTLTVATYNVLAQCFVEPDRYAYVRPASLLEPGLRMQHLLETIVSLDAHIVLLQEVELDLLSALQARLGDDHRVLYARRPTHSDGCAIVLDARRIELVDQRALVYRHREPGYSQVACTAHLRWRELDIGLVSTHLRCGCQAQAGEAPLGQLQMRELLDYTRDSAWVSSRSWILGGDLNATPDDPTLAEAYAAGFRRAGDAPTAHIRGRSGKRDYLLHGDALALRGQTPQAFEVLPNAEQPSDHVAFVAQLSDRRYGLQGQ